MMSHIPMIPLLLALLVPVTQAWLKFPYGNDDFNQRVEYGDNVTVTCNDGRIPDPYTVAYWIRPDMTIMLAGESESFWTLDGYASWYVSEDGKQLQATLLNDQQFGFYYCIAVSDSDSVRYAAKRAINYNGPYFGNKWSKYRMNVIIGSSAAGGFLVLCLFFGLLTTWCERPGNNKETSIEMVSRL